MGKGKDKKQRTRRKATKEELAKRKEKREKRLAEEAKQKAEEEKKKAVEGRLRFQHLLNKGNASAADEETEESEAGTSDDEKSLSGNNSDSDDSDDSYEALDIPRVRGTAGVNSDLLADLDIDPRDEDDDSSNEEDEDECTADQSSTDSVMKNYCSKVLERIRYEASQDFPVLHKKWLHELLVDNDYWIPKSRAKYVCRKLQIHHSFEEHLYYRDVFVWLPEVQGGQTCMPCCVSCKRHEHVAVHDYTMHHPARYIVSLNSHYYMMTRRYICHACKRRNKELEEEAATNGTHCEKVQFTFMGWNSQCLKLMPYDQLDNFPAILTHRAGVDRMVLDLLPPLFDAGLGPERLSEMLLELHTAQYYNNYRRYEVALGKRMVFKPDYIPVMFSELGDKTRYNGRVPTGRYLQAVYMKWCKKFRPHMEQEVKKISCERLHIDGSVKVCSRLCRDKGGIPLQFHGPFSVLFCPMGATYSLMMGSIHLFHLPLLHGREETEKEAGIAKSDGRRGVDFA